MGKCILLILSCVVLSSSAWSLPYYPVPRAPVRVVRYAVPPHQHHHAPPPPPPPHHRIPVRVIEDPVHESVAEHEQPQRQRPKRGHDYDDDHRGSSGVTGPVHTFVKTDKNANYKWGVRHHVGDKFSS